MIGRVFGRVGSGVLVVWLVSVLAFGLLLRTPGDPARLILNAKGIDAPSSEVVAAMRADLGLDAPPLQRYVGWAAGVVRGDWGASYRTGKPAWDMYSERLPATAVLAALAFVLSLAIAVPLGMIAAYRRGSLVDGAAQAVASFGAAVPAFFFALLLVLIFAAKLRWLPALGAPTLRGLILPAVVLALPNVALLSRLVRAGMLDALGQDYITTARAKGRSRRSAMIAHALPNVMLGVVPVVALEGAYLLTSTAVVETVFAFPGVGRLAVDAALIGDMPVVVLCVMIAACVYVVCNWVADGIVATFDPRVRTL